MDSQIVTAVLERLQPLWQSVIAGIEGREVSVKLKVIKIEEAFGKLG